MHKYGGAKQLIRFLMKFNKRYLDKMLINFPVFLVTTGVCEIFIPFEKIRKSNIYNVIIIKTQFPPNSLISELCISAIP